jgi:hypothetical protein
MSDRQPITVLTDAIDEMMWTKGPTDEGYELLAKTFQRHSRWSVWFQVVFKYEGAAWAVDWPIPATEMQESEIWDETVEAYPVEPIEETVTVYRKLGVTE